MSGVQTSQGADERVTVPVTGLWIRTAGSESSSERRVEVLLEVDRTWRLVDHRSLQHLAHGEVSVIIEPAGLVNAPEDDAVDPRSTHCHGGGS